MTYNAPRRGLVIGCGGSLGAAWTVAALVSLHDVLGWDPRGADVLMGTSAGAELVTMIGSGIGVDELLATQLGTSKHPVLSQHLAAAPGRFPPVPRPGIGSLSLASKFRGVRSAAGLLPIGRGDASWLDRLARDLNPGRAWTAHPDVRLVAMDYDTGARIAFGAPGAPLPTLSEALRASWAIPGWFPPVRIDGHRYVDGGAASTASADLLTEDRLDEVIVLAPMASTGRVPVAGGADVLERVLVRNQMSDRLDLECRKLEESGTRVYRIDATAEDLAVMGANFMDYRRRSATLDQALYSTRVAVENHLERGYAQRKVSS